MTKSKTIFNKSKRNGNVKERKLISNKKLLKESAAFSYYSIFI